MGQLQANFIWRATQRLFGAADAKRELKAPFPLLVVQFPASGAEKLAFCVCVCMCIYNEGEEETPYTCLYLRVQKAGGDGEGGETDLNYSALYPACSWA